MNTSAIFNNFRTLDKVPFEEIPIGAFVRSSVSNLYGVIQRIGLREPEGYLKEDNWLEILWFDVEGETHHSIHYHFQHTKIHYIGKSDSLKRSLYIFDNSTMEGDEEFRIKDPNNPKRKVKITKHKQVAIIARSIEHAYASYDGYEWNRDWQLIDIQKLGPSWNDNKEPFQLTDLDWI